MLKALLLSLAVSMDTLFATMGCRASGITISKRCAVMVSAVGTAMLAISLLCAKWLEQLIPVSMLRIGGAGLLAAIGLIQISKELLRTAVRKHRPHIQRRALGLVIDICFDETCADADGNKILGWSETAAFSAACSVDSLVSGLGAGLDTNTIPACLAVTAVLGFMFTIIGSMAGKRMHQRPGCTWLGGTILLLLALMRLLIE